MSDKRDTELARLRAEVKRLKNETIQSRGVAFLTFLDIQGTLQRVERERDELRAEVKQKEHHRCVNEQAMIRYQAQINGLSAEVEQLKGQARDTYGAYKEMERERDAALAQVAQLQLAVFAAWYAK